MVCHGHGFVRLVTGMVARCAALGACGLAGVAGCGRVGSDLNLKWLQILGGECPRERHVQKELPIIVCSGDSDGAIGKYVV